MLVWIGIGIAIVAWLIGLLVAIGPVVHLFLIAAVGLRVFQVWRDRASAER